MIYYLPRMIANAKSYIFEHFFFAQSNPLKSKPLYKMKQEDIPNLTTEELIKKKQKIKSNNWIQAMLIGIFIGIAIYSAVKNGFGFFTFFPLIFAYMLFNNDKKSKAIEKELKSRDSNKKAST